MGHKVYSHRRYVASGFVNVLDEANLTVADGKILMGVPFDKGYLVAFKWGLDDAGGTSGGTSIMLNRVRAETDAEVLAANSTIAHDTTAGYAEVTSFQNNSFQLGDILRVDVAAIPGGSDSNGMWVTAVFHVVED